MKILNNNCLELIIGMRYSWQNITKLLYIFKGKDVENMKQILVVGKITAGKSSLLVSGKGLIFNDFRKPVLQQPRENGATTKMAVGS